MPELSVVLGDITQQPVDAIVNAANNAMRGGGGVDGAIHHCGGSAILRDCIERFPKGLATGEAGWTTAGELPAQWVIHTVGPNYAQGQRDRSLLVSCYRRALAVADSLGAGSVAFPLVSAGVYGWPRQDAVDAAVDTLATAETQVRDLRIAVLDANLQAEVNAQLTRWTALRILQGVAELHRRGYHRVRVWPGMSPSGVHWRLQIAVTDQGPVFGSDHAIYYSSSSGAAFAGGQVNAAARPDAVADLIRAALPHTEPSGDDPAYAAWFADLMRLVEKSHRFPVAYADYFDDTAGWEVGWGSGLRHPHPPNPVL